MKWVVGGAIVLFLLFYVGVFVSAAIYDPETGKKLPEKGRWKRIVFAIMQGFPFVSRLSNLYLSVEMSVEVKDSEAAKIYASAKASGATVACRVRTLATLPSGRGPAKPVID